MLLTTLEHKQTWRHMKTSSVKRNNQAFWSSCTLPRQSGISPFFWIGVHEWQYLETSKLIYHRHWNTFRLSFQISLEKTKCYCNISGGLINRTAKTLDDLGRSDLTIFRNSSSSSSISVHNSSGTFSHNWLCTREGGSVSVFTNIYRCRIKRSG
jgi:hypothetical protein